MKKVFGFLVCAILVITLTYCENNKNDSDLEVVFEMTDTEGNLSNKFSSSDEMRFNLNMTNLTGSKLAWYDFCEIFTETNVYSVYRINTHEDDSESKVYIGQPFTSPVFCQEKPIVINEGEGNYLTLAWANDELTKGNYVVEFNLDLKIDNARAQTTCDYQFTIK